MIDLEDVLVTTVTFLIYATVVILCAALGTAVGWTIGSVLRWLIP